MIFNLNDYFKFQLTPHGLQVMKREHAKLQRLSNGFIKEFEDKTDSAGYITLLAWEFAQIFGSALYNGSQQSVVDNQIEVIPNR